MSSIFLAQPEYERITGPTGAIDIPIYGGINVREHHNFVAPHSVATKLFMVSTCRLALKLSTHYEHLSFEDAEQIIKTSDSVESRELLATFAEDWAALVEMELTVQQDTDLALMMIRRVEPNFKASDLQLLGWSMRDRLVKLAYEEISKTFKPSEDEETDPKKD
jgi:hypothetical protein